MLKVTDQGAAPGGGEVVVSVIALVLYCILLCYVVLRAVLGKYFHRMTTICKDILTWLIAMRLSCDYIQCQRHQMMLENGQRAGFFIGDAAGVGKGRQVRR